LAVLLPAAIAVGSPYLAEAKGPARSQAPPQVLVDDVSTKAGDVATFGLRLSRASTSPVTVDYSTFDGTATVADGDYLPAWGRLTFAAGQTYTSVTVQTLPDVSPESGEEFQLGAAIVKTDGTLASSTVGSCRIRTQYEISIHSLDGGGVSPGYVATFLVRLNVVPTSPIAVDYTTVDASATVADGDYLSASGTLIFGPGERDKLVTVQTLPNLSPEYIEAFYLWAGIVATDGSSVHPSVSECFIWGEDGGGGGWGPYDYPIGP
jgi:hypothetical protein